MTPVVKVGEPRVKKNAKTVAIIRRVAALVEVVAVMVVVVVCVVNMR